MTQGYMDIEDYTEAEKLRKEIHGIEAALWTLRKALENIETKCGHKEWTEPQSLAERINNEECNVKWRRRCKNCGLVQTTTKFKEKKIEVPVF